MSDLEQIVDGAEPEQVENEPVKQETAAQEPEAIAEPEAAPEPKAEPKADQTVPLAALLEVRQELRQLREASQPRPAPQPMPDVFEDPAGYSQRMQDELRTATTASKLEMSRFMADREFGKENVDAMMEHFNNHPEQTQAFLKTASPFHTAMEQFNSQRVAQEIGNDPAAYRAKLEAEIRGKIEAEMVAKQARDNAGKFAPSMANVTGTGGGPKSNWTGPADLSSILGE